MTLHQKAGGGNEKLNTGFAGHLPVPRTFDDWHATTQLNQARAITYAIEHFRSYAPRTAGSIIWQLNDCWPVSSWAAVDGEKRRKPLWYALRAVNAAHLLTIQPRPEGLSLVICNDDGAAWEADIEVTRITFGGRELAAQRVKVSVPAHSNVEVSLVRVLEKVSDPSEEVLVAVERAGTSRRAFWYFAEDVNLNIPPFDAHVDVVDVDGGVSVEVTASGFVKDLVLNPDRLDPDARAEEMFVTLFPGEMARIRVTTARDLDFGALTRHPVLTSVNHLLHPQP
jgi:beta-mannosidase